MRKRLLELGVMDRAGHVAATAKQTTSLYAMYLKAGGDTRSTDALGEEAIRKIEVLSQRGYDLGLWTWRGLRGPARGRSTNGSDLRARAAVALCDAR